MPKAEHSDAMRTTDQGTDQFSPKERKQRRPDGPRELKRSLPLRRCTVTGVRGAGPVNWNAFMYKYTYIYVYIYIINVYI